MRALIPTNDPDALVRTADVPEPEPAAGEVLIEVEAFSVNRGEIFLLEKAHARPGWRPGQDVAGRIVRTVDGGPPVGTRVAALVDWEGWAERVRAPLSALAVLPDGVSAATAAALPLAGITALRLLRAAGPLIGTRVLLTGAAGGVGHLITELAVAAGAEVVVVTSTAERAEALLKLGASTAVRSVEQAPGRFDVVLESVGGPSLAAAVELAEPETGLVLWYGQASRQPVELEFFAVMGPASGIRIVPFSYHATAVGRPDDLATLVRMVAQGRLHVEIGRESGWQHTAGVLAELQARQIRGKAVLHVDRS